MDKNIQLLIVDDIESHRRRLERIITACDDMELISSVDSGQAAVQAAIAHQPDIILMDIEMEEPLAGINAARQIHELFPHIKIIIVTVHKDDNIIFAAFQTGIIDYLVKSAAQEEVIEAIRSAYGDSSPIRPMIAKSIRSEFARIKRTENSFLFVIQIISGLTPSELQVLKLLCEKKTRRQIAEERCVEYETIKKQMTSILKKFNMASSADIIRTVNDLRIFDLLNKI
ncbi:MAG: response regulator [Candidatus Pristimantibacillus sp.]